MPEEKKSTHRVEVVPIALEKLPNSDFLSTVKVFGFTCVVNTEAWQGHETAAYLPPDSLVDVARPEFNFLAADAKADGKARIKAKKLRGILSFGLLVPTPNGANLGDDVSEILGVTHYDPAVRKDRKTGLFLGGEVAKAPNVYCVKYDLDSGRRYAEQLFVPGEQVVITEKVHGCLEKNTLITLASGETRPIEQIQAGDSVVTYNEVTKTLENKNVIRQIIQPPDDRLRWIEITLENGNTIIVTDDHLFLTNTGWVPAGELNNNHDLIEHN